MNMYIIDSVEQLLALASPGRDDIVDAVGLIGPCSVPELARLLERPHHALYYHVKALRDCGILRERQISKPGKKRTATYDLPGRPMSIRYTLDTEKQRRAVIALAQTRLRSAVRGFTRACRPEIAITSGLQRNLWVARWKGWLSDADLKQANRYLIKILNLFRHGGARKQGRRPHEFTFALAPVQRLISKS
ncbi:MAG TPA: helix-turn-helix domain-containing protein [Candidatus Angelobacter sp.]|jgi:DNA-binding transcriptional ArsR family regulator